MKNKVWVFIVIGLLLMIGLVGKVFLDNQKDKEETREQTVEKDLIEAERLSVVALKKTFADIRSIEFEKSSYNEKTGFYSMIVKMTNVDDESAVFDYMFTINRPNEIEGWGIVDKEKVQKKEKLKVKSKFTILMEVRKKYNDYRTFTSVIKPYKWGQFFLCF